MIIGGKIIGAGGFGCVFRPALRCKNSNERTHGISKLSIINESNIEWTKLELVKKYIKKIPNYQNYFLLNDLEKCQPAKLDNKDTSNFENCNALQRYNITKNNINNKLHELQIINMPFGGIDLNQLFTTYQGVFSIINNHLINLLLNGIIPMNNLNLYHLDIKDTNLVYDKKNIRIIDFGEAGISTSTEIIPYAILRTPVISYNVPFSRILFGGALNNYLKAFLTKYKINQSSPRLHERLQSFMKTYMKEIDVGMTNPHAMFLAQIYLPSLIELGGQQVSKINLVEHLVSKYCAIALVKYINFSTKTFNVDAYFKEVYSKNVDIYGFIMSYYSIIGLNIQNINYIKANVANIIIKYCFSDEYASIPININELVDDLKKLNFTSTTIPQINLDKLYRP